MLNNLKKNKDGFTIIEVMIVLAIAGLIILVVLLAIPALQRNSRNTTIKNDASAVAGAIQEFQGANNGKMPTTVTVSDGTVTVKSTVTGTTEITGKVKAGTDVEVGATIGSTKADTGKIVVVLERKCTDAGNDVDTAVNKRSIALLYNVETSGNPAKNCLDA